MVFVDREEELTWLISLYYSKKKGNNINAIIYGLRRVGKTSLLREFVSRVEYGILMDLSYVSNGKELIRDLKDAINDFAREKKLKKIVFEEPNASFDALKMLVEIPDRFASKNRILLALCLDEFHVLLEGLASRIALEEKIRYSDALEKVFWFLKSKIPQTKNVFWVLSTSLSWHLLERYTKTPSRKAFLALFSVKEIKPLDKSSSIELILKLSNSFDYQVTIEIAERIYEVTGGIPALIEIIITHIAPQKIKDIGKFEKFMESLSQSTELNDYFETIINFFNEVSRHGKASLLSVMRSISEGTNTPKEIAKKLNIKYNVVYNILEELVEIGLVKKEKNGKENRYFLQYPLMKTWLLSTKPYITEEDKEKIRYSLGIMFEKYIKGLFEQATKLNKPILLEEKEGKYFNNTTERLEILPIFKIETVKGRPETHVDLIAIGKIGRRELFYIIECKYTMSPINPEEIIKFSKRVKTIISLKNITNYVAIIIQGGEGGYNPASIATALKNNIITLTKQGLTQLAKKLNYPKIN